MYVCKRSRVAVVPDSASCSANIGYSFRTNHGVLPTWLAAHSAVRKTTRCIGMQAVGEAARLAADKGLWAREGAHSNDHDTFWQFTNSEGVMAAAMRHKVNNGKPAGP
jgi:hypothetical protein